MKSIGVLGLVLACSTFLCLTNGHIVPLVPEIEIQPRSVCSFAIRKTLPTPTPLYLIRGTSQMFPYNSNGAIDMKAGESLELACPTGFGAPLSGTTAIATCVGDTVFEINGSNQDISKIVCSSWTPYVGQKSGRSCNGGTTLINVGFQIDSQRFLKDYEVCFNEDLEVTRYVYHTISAGNEYYATGIDRINFITGGYFAGKNVDKLYTQASQKATIDKALGLDDSNYFSTTGNIFLARGHMAAKADFVYGSNQRATFFFINVAPQWQAFNAGNWAKVEDGVRDWVHKNNMNVECWTGIYGVTTLPNKNGVETPLYLTYDKNNNGLIPVPKLYYRVVIDTATSKGIVLIGVNNPHLTLQQIQKDYILCNDVSDKITWLKWKKTDITVGYSYACEVNEFRKVVTDLPDFKVSGLLY